MHIKKSFFILTVSVLIIIYGFSGLSLSAIAFGKLNRYFPLKPGDTKAEDSINDSIISAVRLMENTSDVLNNAALTLRQIENSLINSQKLLGDTSEAFFDIAETVNFEILGYRPLEKTYKYFTNIGNILSALSFDIEATSRYLGTNSDDLIKTSKSMDTVAININKTYENFSGPLVKAAESGNTFIRYLLIYIMAMHTIFILIGTAIILK